MGQKINPISLRISIVKPWSSRWFFPAKTGTGSVGRYPYAKFLEEDEAIRKIVWKRIELAGVASIDIERTSNSVKILIRAARPGFVIGQGGKGIEDLTKAIEARLKKIRAASPGGETRREPRLSVNVEELKRSEVSAAYIAQQISWDLAKRLHFRRLMKKYLDQIMQNKDVKGAKIHLSGRLGGTEIARRETLRKGALPLQTLRADIDYGTATAHMSYGAIGIKVWVYKGQVFEKKKTSSNSESLANDRITNQRS